MAESKTQVVDSVVKVAKEVPVREPKTVRDLLVQEGKRVFKEPARDVHQFVPVYPSVEQVEAVDVRTRDNLHQKPLA